MDETKSNIIKVCEKIFPQYGIRSVSIDDVCKQLGISKKTFYIYFKQKEDLVDAFLTTLEEIEEMMMRTHMGKGNAIDNLLAFMRRSKVLIDTQQQYPALAYDLQKYYPKVLKRHQRLREAKLTRAFADNMQKGINEGLYREDLNIDMLCAFFGLEQMIAIFFRMKESLKDKNVSYKQMVEFFIDMLARYMVTTQGWDYLMTQMKVNNQNIKLEIQ